MTHSSVTTSVQAKKSLKIPALIFKKYIPLINNELLLQKNPKKTIGISLALVGSVTPALRQQFKDIFLVH